MLDKIKKIFKKMPKAKVEEEAETQKKTLLGS